jgi:cobalamin biosynthesis protein CobT
LVQASQTTAARTVRRGNRLDPSKLYRVGVKDDRIFARREEKVAPNTAMHLLVDLSGSMGFETLHDGRTRPKDDYQVALDAAMALALALEPINGVSCAATAFPSQKGGQDRVTRILSHGDRVARRTGAFVQSARGGTPMTGALWYAAADLLARREERKVILTITDGQPADQDSAKDMVRKATAAGVEMIGVGIKVDVSHLFPVAIQIASVADLKGELFGIAEKLLLR